MPEFRRHGAFAFKVWQALLDIRRCSPFTQPSRKNGQPTCCSCQPSHERKDLKPEPLSLDATAIERFGITPGVLHVFCVCLGKTVSA